MHQCCKVLVNNINNFLQYCKNSNLSERSIESLSFRLNEFNKFMQSYSNFTIKKINYQLLSQFVADYDNPSSLFFKKARIWSLRQFFHFLKLQHLILHNITLQLPYPKIEKKVPPFLTTDEFNRVLKHFAQLATNPISLRNLVLIALLDCLILRTATIADLNITDIELAESRIWIKEKGYQGLTKRAMPLTCSEGKIVRFCLKACALWVKPVAKRRTRACPEPDSRNRNAIKGQVRG